MGKKIYIVSYKFLRQFYNNPVIKHLLRSNRSASLKHKPTHYNYIDISTRITLKKITIYSIYDLTKVLVNQFQTEPDLGVLQRHDIFRRIIWQRLRVQARRLGQGRVRRTLTRQMQGRGGGCSLVQRMTERAPV